MSLPLVIVPGILEDQASWRTLAGLSSDVKGGDNCGGGVEDMAACLPARMLERFVLLGHSLGGYVALAAAITGVRLARLIGCGHMCLVEERAGFAVAVAGQEKSANSA